MGRVLIVAERDSLLPALFAALAPGDEVRTIPGSDLLFSESADVAGARLIVFHLPSGVRPAPAYVLGSLVRRARRAEPDVRVLIVYEHARRALAGKLLAGGGDALLEEPYGLEEIRRVVNGLLARPSAAASTPPAAPVRRAESDSAPGHGHAPAPPPAPVPPPEPVARHNGAAPNIADLDLLSVFVRGLAHEVNNPLTTIRGFLQLLLHTQGPVSKDAETLDAYRTMEVESRRIAELIQELEYFSGVRRPTRTWVDLTRLVQDALRACELTHVLVRVTGGEMSLFVDREQMQYALRHLFGAVAKLAPSQPAAIEAALSRDGERVELQLDLRGVTDAKPQRLLIPAWGGKGGPEARRSLACAFGIARSHGGDLKVDSIAEGLRFRLSLPARALAGEPERADSA